METEGVTFQTWLKKHHKSSRLGILYIFAIKGVWRLWKCRKDWHLCHRLLITFCSQIPTKPSHLHACFNIGSCVSGNSSLYAKYGQIKFEVCRREKTLYVFRRLRIESFTENFYGALCHLGSPLSPFVFHSMETVLFVVPWKKWE